MLRWDRGPAAVEHREGGEVYSEKLMCEHSLGKPVAVSQGKSRGEASTLSSGCPQSPKGKRDMHLDHRKWSYG